MFYKKGEPVIYKGKNCIIETERYTARFLDSQDYEMIANGMGEYAGSYGNAYNLYCPEEGHSYRKVACRYVKSLKEHLDSLKKNPKEGCVRHGA